MKKIDLKGKRYGNLVVLSEAGRNKHNHLLWFCKCDCGREKVILGDSLRRGVTKSCGCFASAKTSERNSKHGFCHECLYRIWSGIKTRTTNEKRPEYADYGGRGIKMCDAWFQDYISFRNWALANGYDDSLSVDRIDVNGNYEPFNCRWADSSVQMNNQRSNYKISYKGRTLTLTQWAKEIGIPRPTLSDRIFRQKLPIEKALIP